MFTEEEKQVILSVQDVLNNSILIYPSTRRWIKHGKKMYFGLCGIILEMNQNVSIEKKLKPLAETYKEENNIECYDNYFYWFPIDKNRLKYRREFINWVILNHFN